MLLFVGDSRTWEDRGANGSEGAFGASKKSCRAGVVGVVGALLCGRGGMVAAAAAAGPSTSYGLFAVLKRTTASALFPSDAFSCYLGAPSLWAEFAEKFAELSCPEI